MEDKKISTMTGTSFPVQDFTDDQFLNDLMGEKPAKPHWHGICYWNAEKIS